ncbi:uncharacterized protein JCM15063_004786 [Sporobolomyces koalae]|uniref:uncharacterized protein n=1 Tax=Sporobolomyces koalae TaxID=500713 RepID=UPI00316BE13F
MSDSLSRVPLLSANGQSQRAADHASLTLQSLAASYGALQAGKLPTSDQLVQYIQAILRTSVLQPEIGGMVARKAGGAQLSKRGKELVVDTRRLLESINRLILEKNDDDKIQRFIWQASEADVDVDVDVAGNLELPSVPVPSKKEVKEAAGSLHQLFTLLLTSHELRNLIGDGVNLFRDVFADAAEGVADATIKATRASKKAAKKARPSEKERKEHHIPGEGLYWEDAAMNVQNFRKQVKRDAEDKRDETLRQGVKKAREFKEYVEEELSTDALDAIKERFKAIVNEIQDQPEYSEAINTLSGLARKYFELAKEEVVESAKATTANIDLDAEPNQEAENAVGLFRQIVESFTGDIGPALSAASAVYKHLENDERFQKIWSEFEELVDRAINDPGYVTSEKASRRFEKMYNEARSIVESNAEWKKDANHAIAEAQKLLDNAANDKALLAVADACEKLGESAYDFGETGFNLMGSGGGDLWKDVSQVFLPRLLGALKEVPLPRVEFTSEDLDLIVDNIRFESASFIPDGAHFRSVLDYTTQKGYAAYASEGHVSTTLSFAGLRMAAKNISYYINKKTGWVGLEDSGLLDIYLGSEHPDADNGLDVTLVLENANEADRESFFKLKRVDVDISGFEIAIRQSSHPIRNWLARGAVRSFMEVKIKEVLEEQIAHGFAQLDRSLFTLQYKATGAAAAAADPLSFLRAILTPTPTTAPSLVSQVTSTGITKVDPKGQWILAIGVEDDLLPGRLTGLGRQGRDVVGRKRQVESLMEEGQAELLDAVGADDAEDLEEGARQTVDGLTDAAKQERKKALRAAKHAKKAELRRSGWKSDLFDL